MAIDLNRIRNLSRRKKLSESKNLVIVRELTRQEFAIRNIFEINLFKKSVMNA